MTSDNAAMIPVSGQVTSPLRRLACARCGTAFECGVAAGACWCMDEVYRLPMPDDGAADCLCPTCLRAAAGPTA